LRLEGAAAAAGRLYVGVVKLETRPFERLHVIDFRAVEIKKARLVDEDLQAVVSVCLVEHVRRVLEGHRIAEARAPSADYSDPQTGRSRILGGHDLLHLADRFFR